MSHASCKQNLKFMHNFCNRFLARRKALGYTQQEMAEFLGVSVRTVASWEKGDNVPHPSTLRDVATKLQVPIAYLTGGMREEELKSTSIAAPHYNNGKIVYTGGNVGGIRMVPVVSWMRAGEATSYDDLCNQIDERVETSCKDPNAFALIIEGDSMEPTFRAGYRVVFAPNDIPRNGDFVVARLLENGGVLFKLFHRTGPEGKTIILESLNPAYKPLELDESMFRFIYPAYEVKFKLRH